MVGHIPLEDGILVRIQVPQPKFRIRFLARDAWKIKNMKTIVITGASRGIGLATAKKFLAEGWRVIGTYLNTAIPIQDENLTPIKYDQGDSKRIAQAVEEIKKVAPKIDALINNAGIILDGLDETINMDKIRKTFEVDLFGVIDLTEKLSSLLNPEAHVVNIDSLYGSFSFPIDDDSSSAYRMAKAALNMYTRTLAYRLKNKEVVVSSLDPGWVKTDMGNLAATETLKPDRTPEEAAEDIFNLVTREKETGQFWKEGKKTDW